METRNAPVDHVEAKVLEQYALDGLSANRALAIEEHLSICGACRERLTESELFIERLRALYRGFDSIPLDHVHLTEEGPIRLKVEKSEGCDEWSAVLSGAEIEMRGRFLTVLEANEFLLRSFREMFPGHQCSDGCMQTPG
jgi:anti-sigma factor RsiW